MCGAVGDVCGAGGGVCGAGQCKAMAAAAVMSTMSKGRGLLTSFTTSFQKPYASLKHQSRQKIHQIK
jgi:L-arabinose isomerase